MATQIVFAVQVAPKIMDQEYPTMYVARWSDDPEDVAVAFTLHSALLFDSQQRAQDWVKKIPEKYNATIKTATLTLKE